MSQWSEHIVDCFGMIPGVFSMVTWLPSIQLLTLSLFFSFSRRHHNHGISFPIFSIPSILSWAAWVINLVLKMARIKSTVGVLISLKFRWWLTKRLCGKIVLHVSFCPSVFVSQFVNLKGCMREGWCFKAHVSARNKSITRAKQSERMMMDKKRKTRSSSAGWGFDDQEVRSEARMNHTKAFSSWTERRWWFCWWRSVWLTEESWSNGLLFSIHFFSPSFCVSKTTLLHQSHLLLVFLSFSTFALSLLLLVLLHRKRIRYPRINYPIEGTSKAGRITCVMIALLLRLRGRVVSSSTWVESRAQLVSFSLGFPFIHTQVQSRKTRWINDLKTIRNLREEFDTKILVN